MSILAQMMHGARVGQYFRLSVSGRSGIAGLARVPFQQRFLAVILVRAEPGPARHRFGRPERVRVHARAFVVSGSRPDPEQQPDNTQDSG